VRNHVHAWTYVGPQPDDVVARRLADRDDRPTATERRRQQLRPVPAVVAGHLLVPRDRVVNRDDGGDRLQGRQRWRRGVKQTQAPGQPLDGEPHLLPRVKAITGDVESV